MRQINPPKLMLFCIILMITFDLWLPIMEVGHWFVSIMGLFIMVSGGILAKSGSDYFEEKGTNIETFLPPDMLVSDGLYKYSRNPMYLGFMLLLIGLTILLGSLAAAVVCGLFFLVMNAWYIPYEEKVMHEIFRDAYAKYKLKTRRWL